MGRAGAQDRLKFNVRGRIFETTMTTMASACGSSTFFSALLSDRWNSSQHGETGGTEEIFIDRNPDCFGALLDLLGTGQICIPGSVTRDFLYKEALYYGLEGQLQTASRGKLNGDLLRLSHRVLSPSPTVAGREDQVGKALIRASPSGGFCVTNGNIVHNHNDWNMEEQHPPIRLGKSRIYDIGWYDSHNIMILTPGNVELLNSVTGRLSHGFSEKLLSHWPVSFQALCTNPNNEVFLSCASKDTGTLGAEIAVWDPISGKIKRRLGSRIGMVRKQQWVSGINSLFIVHHDLKGKLKLKIQCLDPRVAKKSDKACCPPGVVDAVADETTNKIYLLDRSMKTAFVDYRRLEGCQWTVGGSMVRRANESPQSIHCHEGQLFACTRRNVFVSSGDVHDWFFTKVQASDGEGSIQDISIGGDRLFASHTSPNIIKVYETPRPLIEF